jgi:hypothetical protein
MTCPHCGGDLNITRLQPIEDWSKPFQSYDTIIECSNCFFETRASSCKLMGSVTDFDFKNITISSWSPSGSRVTTELEHLMDYEELKELKTGNKLVEFLVVDDHVVKLMK